MSNLRDIGLNKRMRFELLHAVQYTLQQTWPTVCPPSLTALSGIHVYREKDEKESCAFGSSYLFHIYIYIYIKIVLFSYIYIYEKILYFSYIFLFTENMIFINFLLTSSFFFFATKPN